MPEQSQKKRTVTEKKPPAHRTLNGVDTVKLLETMDMIKKDPELAKCEFRATNKWVYGGHNRASVKGFYAAGDEDKSRTKPFLFDMDEPPVLLGKDEGANPVELVLAGLSGCMMTTMVYYAGPMGVTVKEAWLELDGDIDLHGLLGLSKNIRPGYQQIRVKVHLDTDGTKEQEERLIELAKKHSPVFNTIEKPVDIKVTQAA